MNKVILMGRLTRDPDIRYSTAQDGTQNTVARYTLAVDRRGRSQDGQQSADFISCVCFGHQAEFTDKYLRQGTKIAISGRIVTGSYTRQDGQKVYTTDVNVEEQEFAESKQQSGQQATQQPPQMQQAPQQAPPQQTAQQSRGRGRGQQRQQQAPQQAPGYGDEWMQIPQGIENDLPFR